MIQYNPTVSQKLIWIDQAISPDSAKYNIGGYAYLEGNIDYGVFNKALQQIICSQEVYSTIFNEADYKLVCTAKDPDESYTINIIDLSFEADPEASAINAMNANFGVAFEMHNNLLFEFKLFKINPEKHFWYAKIHHIIGDGMSFKILLNQTAEIYDSLVQSGEANFTRYEYSEYATEDEGYYRSDEMLNDKAFWLDKFIKPYPELISKIIGKKHAAEPVASDTLYLPKNLKYLLQTTADNNRVSIFNLIISLLLIYFNRTKQQDSLCFGIPVLNRTKKKYRSTAGVFMNLLAVRFDIDKNDTFNDVARRVKENMSQSLRHQKYQYGNLVKDLQISGGKTLYELRISYEDFEFTSEFGGLKTGAIALSNLQEIDKLAIYLRDYHDDGLDIRFVYSTDYFDSDSIKSIKDGLYQMISSIAGYDSLPVCRISLLNTNEREKILTLTSGSVREKSFNSFLNLWAAAAENFAQNTCISCSTGSYSYDEINNSAQQLSRALAQIKGNAQDVIALMLPRSEKMVVGMLGSMMAGISYIPLDLEYPSERIGYILNDSTCTLLLTSEELRPLYQYHLPTRVFSIEELLGSPQSEIPFFEVADCADKACYIIYTSGSTGKPKGVSISNNSMVDYVQTFNEYFKLDHSDVVVQQASISFDTSVEEIFPIFSVGGRLHIVDERKDIFNLSKTICEQGITLLSSNPQTIKYLNTCQLPPSLRIIISGGDVLRKEYADNILNCGIEVYNTYGPTESTVCATYYRLTKHDSEIPIGKPINNREIYILDDCLHLQPFGVEGEIYLGGEGLALGYINNELLTSERFIPNPFKPGCKLYKTGDRGILKPDGNIFFNGRTDNQLNYRGYRVEAGEIENAVIEMGGVENCFVTLVDFNSAPVLVAYVQAENPPDDFVPTLKKNLSSYLPAYMVPGIIIPVNTFPLSVSGKINKFELPAVDAYVFISPEADRIMPRTKTEQQIFDLWVGILGGDQFGTTDSFFELGGHSLSAMQLLNQFDREFKVRLTIRDLFENTTISSQAILIASVAPGQYVSINSISPANDYAVSDGQRRLWVLSQFEDEARAYHLSGFLKLSGDYNVVNLENSIRCLIFRHEILRTVFFENEEGELRQRIIDDNGAFTLSLIDHRGKHFDEATDVINTESFRNFDLSNGPLLRAGLILTDTNSYILYYVMHHIISDGWSMELLSREVMENYESYERNEPPVRSPLRIQYKDYSVWQQEQLSGEVFAGHRSYWQEQLSGELPVVSLPGEGIRPSVQTHNGYELYTKISREDTDRLSVLCREHQGTLFMGLLSVMNALLYRYTGQEDMIIGSPVAGREHSDLEDQIGFYINTLALRTRLKGSDSFSELLEKVREVTLSAYSHQMYPFDRLVEDLGVRRDMSRSAIFDVMLALQNQNEKGEIAEEITVLADHGVSHRGSCAVKFDINVSFSESAGGLEMSLQYNSDVYEQAFMVRFMEHYKQMLGLLTLEPSKALGKQEYLFAAEREELLAKFNNTETVYTPEQSLLSLISRQALESPAATAVEYEGTALSYGELEARSNQLARYLLSKGVISGGLVPVCMDRSAEMIIGLLGILKAGAAFVPIDPSYPLDRISYMISDVKAGVIVTGSEYASLFKESGAVLVQPDKEKGAIGRKSAKMLANGPTGHDLAYVIYTSGSTGNPKGVLIEHHSLLNFLCSMRERLGVSPSSSLLAVTTYSFDIAYLEFYLLLITGGKVIICSREKATSGQGLSGELSACLPTHMQGTPSTWQMLRESGWTNGEGVEILCGGEALKEQQKEWLLSISNGSIWNLYGPTEATIWATIKEIRAGQKVTIGRPLGNTRMYILDEAGQLVAKGITGELYISGAQLARGYLNQPGLTAERFIANPFKAGELMYRTGDIGRWLSDGEIELAGRIDGQVKIRGYRIELGEVEHALEGHPEVSSCVAAVKQNGEGEKELAVYIISNKELMMTDVRNYLKGILPAYMIPSHFVQMESLPLTPNGKVDRKQLPDIAGMGLATGTVYQGPRNETEEKLVRIWQDVFKSNKQIGINDNFFDLGGHSIKITQLASHIFKVFKVKIELRELFTNLILQEQASLISETEKTSFESIRQIEVQPYYPLSSAQQRLWILSRFEESNKAYNISEFYLIGSELNLPALEYSFRMVLERHEILRTNFKENEYGEIKQFVRLPEELPFTITNQDWRNKPRLEEEIQALVRDEFVHPFDLSSGHLLRAGLYRVSDSKWVFTFSMHHIISDGWSMNILIKEILTFYHSCINKTPNPLKSLTIQYKDYAAWHQDKIAGKELQSHQKYWLKQLEGDLPVLELPIDKQRPAIKSYNGGSVIGKLDADSCQRLKLVSQENGATLFMILLAVLNTLLFRYTNQEDIIVGSPVTGRQHIDLDDQIGFYVNILPLRTRFSGNDSFQQLLISTKEAAFSGFEHQIYPFDQLLTDLNLRKDVSRSHLFDVMLVLENETGNNLKDPLNSHFLDINELERDYTISKFDIVFNFFANGPEINFRLEYNSDLFFKSTIEQMAGHFKELAKALIHNPLVPVKNLEYLSPAEKNKVLVEFNDTTIAYPRDKTVIELFEEQVEKTPDNIALVFGDREYSYQELNRKSNQLGVYLRNTLGISPDDTIAIKLDKSDLLIIAILGVLKSGCAYVPVDTGYPAERIKFMVTDSHCKAVIDNEWLDNINSKLESVPVQVLNSINKPEDLATVMYTSGSTGQPKGVLVENRGVLRLVKSCGYVQLTGNECLLSTGSVSFDATIFEYWSMLLNGGKLVICSNEVLLNSARLALEIEAKKIDMMWFTASWLHQLINDDIEIFKGLKTIIAGGDKLSPPHINKLLERYPALNIINGYGPTENTTFSLTYNIKSAGANIPIGKPISNSSAIILDKNRLLVPIGVKGEIYVSGDGLARGYLNRADLTEEKFITNPFNKQKKLYSTGDLGRWLPDGNIEFAGRIDTQIKVRGYRIEPGEIELALCLYPGVDAAKVIVKRNNADEPLLVAYIVCKNDVDIAAIKKHVGKYLPVYMMPGYFIRLGQIPLTPNGKTDFNSLPFSEDITIPVKEDYVAPRNKIEEQLVLIWQEILEMENIGIKDNFFDLGAHSLKVAQLISRINKVFLIQLGVHSIFKDATIENIAGQIAFITSQNSQRKNKEKLIQIEI